MPGWRGDVTAAAVEELDLAVDSGAIEARQHEGAVADHDVLQADGGALHVDGAVVVEDHDVGGIDEGKPKVLGHEVGGEPLAAGDHVLRGVLLDVACEGLELLGNRPLEAQLVGDVLEALLDVGEKRRAVHVVLHVGVDQQEQVGDLVVAGEALAGGGDHHEAAVGIGLDDVLDLAELLGRGYGGAANFAILIMFVEALPMRARP